MGDVLNFKFKGYVHYSLDVTHLHVLDILYVAMNEQYRYEIFGPQIHLRFAVFVQEILRRSSEPVYPSIAMRRFGVILSHSIAILFPVSANSHLQQVQDELIEQKEILQCALYVVACARALRGDFGILWAAFMLSCHSSFDICHLSSVICHSFEAQRGSIEVQWQR